MYMYSLSVCRVSVFSRRSWISFVWGIICPQASHTCCDTLIFLMGFSLGITNYFAIQQNYRLYLTRVLRRKISVGGPSSRYCWRIGIFCLSFYCRFCRVWPSASIAISTFKNCTFPSNIDKINSKIQIKSQIKFTLSSN